MSSPGGAGGGRGGAGSDVDSSPVPRGLPRPKGSGRKGVSRKEASRRQETIAPQPLLDREAFLSSLKDKLKEKSQDKHPLMLMLYAGKLSPKQVRAWIINRFYLQKNIPLKDAAILSNCPETEVRRLWIGRIMKREGIGGSIGDVEGWIGFAESAGVTRDDILRARCLPGVRFAVDGYVNFARKADWTEGVAASLIEYFAKSELVKRIEAFKRHYPWIEPEGYRFFMSRLGDLDEANETTLRIVLRYCQSREMQLRAIEAAVSMADIYWSLHDAIYVAYVIEDRPITDSLSV
jgi:pyrroloquinoline-quinone synthase